MYPLPGCKCVLYVHMILLGAFWGQRLPKQYTGM
jgi:hypothetical protein